MTVVRSPQAATDAASTHSVVSVRGARMAFGERVLWDALDLEIVPGEFIAVLGPNGSGKTTLLQVLLGLRHLTAGEVLVDGRPPGRGSDRIGYIPQQSTLEADLPLRARDLVGLGLDGHRLGLGPLGPGARRVRRRRIDAAMAEVGATGYADAPLARLSGGEQQRLRVAQALVGEPSVLLCDEPLLSLDLASQRTVAMLIEIRRRTAGTPVVFVTHEINPVLPLVDRVLYLVDGQFRIGPVEEVMTTEVLSELYGTRVDVLRVRDRLVVVGAEEVPHHVHGPDE
ncbi:MAG: metal ABC transporter ATP-binding protein [Pseudonocardiales bacterium]|nr:metal ABC transporter ATP-binding protein [Pseudonocardiales bacterium]